MYTNRSPTFNWSTDMHTTKVLRAESNVDAGSNPVISYRVGTGLVSSVRDRILRFRDSECMGEIFVLPAGHSA